MRIKVVKMKSDTKMKMLTFFLFFIFFNLLLQKNTDVLITVDNKDIIPSLSDTNSANDSWYFIWESGYGGLGIDIALDSSDNIYIGGENLIYDPLNHWISLVKFNSLGDYLWDHNWSDYEYSNPGGGIAFDSSDNVYLTGRIDIISPYTTAMTLVKYDGSGVYQWNQTWGGGTNEGARGIAVDSLDNIYLVGSKWGDMALVKYNSQGVEQWNRTWGNSSYDVRETGIGITVDSSDNIYIVGTTRSSGDSDIFFVKYDSSGVEQWNRTWDGGYLEGGFSIALDSTNNIYISGITNSSGAGGYDMVLVKFNELGIEQWNKTWGGSDYESGREIALDSSDNIYLVGITNSYGAGSHDLALVKYNNLGEQQWNLTWGGSGYDSGKAIALDSLDNIYVLGTTDSSMVVIKNPHLDPTEIYPFVPTPTPLIPGYNLFFLLSILSVAVILISKKLKKS